MEGFHPRPLFFPLQPIEMNAASNYPFNQFMTGQIDLLRPERLEEHNLEYQAMDRLVNVNFTEFLQNSNTSESNFVINYKCSERIFFSEAKCGLNEVAARKQGFQQAHMHVVDPGRQRIMLDFKVQSLNKRFYTEAEQSQPQLILSNKIGQTRSLPQAIRLEEQNSALSPTNFISAPFSFSDEKRPDQNQFDFFTSLTQATSSFSHPQIGTSFGHEGGLEQNNFLNQYMGQESPTYAAGLSNVAFVFNRSIPQPPQPPTPPPEPSLIPQQVNPEDRPQSELGDQ